MPMPFIPHTASATSWPVAYSMSSTQTSQDAASCFWETYLMMSSNYEEVLNDMKLPKVPIKTCDADTLDHAHRVHTETRSFTWDLPEWGGTW